MSPLRPGRLLSWAAVAASAALAGCHRSDSILLVEVAGDLTLSPASLNVTVTPGQTTPHSFTAAASGGAAITLPASLSVELAPDVTGPLTVSVVALDAGGAVLANGSATQGSLDVGGQTIVVVELMSATGSSGIDAGQDASADHDPTTGNDADIKRDAGETHDARGDL
ncbi:MAG TPA: hypothetical protein VHG72_10465 [Polyangia bacterium]|nr:hypothetical protein [Polyangia bacterium]